MSNNKIPKQINLLFWLINISMIYLVFKGVQLIYYTVLYPLKQDTSHYYESFYRTNVLFSLIGLFAIATLISAYFFLIKFIRNSKKGIIFNRINFKYLKLFAVLLFIYGTIEIILGKLTYTYLLKGYTIHSYVKEPDAPLNLIFFTAIIIWFLVGMFQHGLKLQRNEDLTV